MKKINKIALLLGSVLFTSISAYADAIYVGGNLGVYGAGRDNNPFDNIFDNDDDLRATGRLNMGYEWDMAPKFKLAVEAGINGFQDHEQDATVVSADDTLVRYHRFSVDVLGVLDYFVVPCVDLFVKAGPVYIHQEASAEHDSLGDVSFDDNGLSGKAVIGVGYSFNPKLNVNLSLSHEFERDNGYDDIDSFPSASSLMLGVKYNFV
jgi:hypothetical protein